MHRQHPFWFLEKVTEVTKQGLFSTTLMRDENLLYEDVQNRGCFVTSVTNPENSIDDESEEF